MHRATNSCWRGAAGAGFWVVLGWAVLGCGAKRSGTAAEQPPPVLIVDPVRCPDLDASGGGKVTHATYLAAHGDLTHAIAVTLRGLPWSPPPCGDDESESARCAERDDALRERQALNAKQVECVYAAFGPKGSLKAAHAQWYELPRFLSAGTPSPIGTAFSTLALWSQIEQVARHPYVERIEPALGESAKLGVAAPTIPTECPRATDVPAPKLEGLADVPATERQPVVIELSQQLLPALRPCPSDEACDDWFASGWERTVVGRRMLTCVMAHIDSKLSAPAPEVAYGGVDGIPLGPKLPPFDDSIHATLSFGLGLTLDEMTEVAKHPYVARIWSSPGLSIGTLPEGCPLDYTAPVQVPECSSETEATSGKFTPESQAAWEAASGPNEVVVAVRRSAAVCPRPACPGRATACPELERYTQRMAEETSASQTCVRGLIASVGGTASEEVLTLGNAFPATLSWDQIQKVAAHPDVAQIDPRYGTAPPLPAGARR